MNCPIVLKRDLLGKRKGGKHLNKGNRNGKKNMKIDKRSLVYN